MNKRVVVMMSALWAVAAHAAPEAAGLCPCQYGKGLQLERPAKSPEPAHPQAKRASSIKRPVAHASPADVSKSAADAVPKTESLPGAAQHSGVYVGVAGIARSVDLDRHGNVGYWWPEQKHVQANGARLSVGYQINDNIAIEAGYMTGFTAKDAYRTPSKVVSYKARSRVDGGDASVIYRFTDYVPGVYVRAGASYMEVSGESVTKNRMRYRNRPGTRVYADKHEAQRQGGFGWLAGMGYTFAVTDHIGLDVAYTRYQGIAGDSKNAMDMLSVGAKYSF